MLRLFVNMNYLLNFIGQSDRKVVRVAAGCLALPATGRHTSGLTLKQSFLRKGWRGRQLIHRGGSTEGL